MADQIMNGWCRRGRLVGVVAMALWLVSCCFAQADEVYVVRRNDTLTGVARKHGLTVKSLAQHNKIRSETKLRIGQRLVIH